MNRIFKISAIVLAVAALQACTRIETGEIGLRRGFDKQVSNTELLPGSFNQTMIGEVMTFPVKDVNVKLDDLTPQAKDNSTMKDMDAVVIYNINPAMAGELYNTKSRAFHASNGGDIYLMYNYVFQAARNAAYKAAREYEALDMNDNRQNMETKMKEYMIATLTDEKLDGAISISQVLIRGIVPADSVVQSANDLVRAKNEYKQKEVEVRTAMKEAERIAALNSNVGAIQYMDAQSRQMIAEGIKNGKVQTLNLFGGNVVPTANVGR